MKKQENAQNREPLKGALAVIMVPAVSFADEELEAITAQVAKQPTTADLYARDAAKQKAKVVEISKPLKVANTQITMARAVLTQETQAMNRLEQNRRSFAKALPEELEAMEYQKSRISAQLRDAEYYKGKVETMTEFEATHYYQNHYAKKGAEIRKYTLENRQEAEAFFKGASVEQRLQKAAELGVPPHLAKKYANSKDLKEASAYLEQVRDNLRKDGELAWEYVESVRAKSALKYQSPSGYVHNPRAFEDQLAKIDAIEANAKSELARVEKQYTALFPKDSVTVQRLEHLTALDAQIAGFNFGNKKGAQALMAEVEAMKKVPYLTEQDVGLRLQAIKARVDGHEAREFLEIAEGNAAKLNYAFQQESRQLESLVAGTRDARRWAEIEARNALKTGEQTEAALVSKAAANQGGRSTLRKVAIGAGALGTGLALSSYGEKLMEMWAAVYHGNRKAPEIAGDASPSGSTTVVPSGVSQDGK